ncbi:hypothetical protein BBI15_07350 [Planococcus plakortidis]|uniref:Uncharacterized protein n=1 Tax=Planococcus plakortidis TaxID=1038856 RepID=A0A1C7E8J0_9BACL|nr:hypothetical protein BBI15_07350 [Planococcus plakortidis]
MAYPDQRAKLKREALKTGGKKFQKNIISIYLLLETWWGIFKVWREAGSVQNAIIAGVLWGVMACYLIHKL